ncbi:MAG: hypothetical protein MK116_12870 [Phycisphaerales bacterium]|nr:hypothetical protein [Phycisphaerales bacterium]
MDNSQFGFLKIASFTDGVEDCVGDLNGDGASDVDDLLLTIGAFGTGAGGDLDGDGETDVSDILAILAAFGQDC